MNLKPSRRLAHPLTLMELSLSPLARIMGLAATVLSLPFATLAANLQFAPAFTSRMVLQHGAPIVLTGHGSAGGSVKVSLGSQERTAKIGADGQWTASLESMSPGGPHILKLSDGNKEVTLEDVLIGDVWLFSGQSNMQMGLGEVIGGDEALAAVQSDAPVRLLMMPKAGAKTPQENPGAEWSHCSPTTLRKFSAVAWFFAQHLRQDPALANVPLGLIDSSFGGTSVEAWTPTERSRRFPTRRSALPCSAFLQATSSTG